MIRSGRSVQELLFLQRSGYVLKCVLFHTTIYKTLLYAVYQYKVCVHFMFLPLDSQVPSRSSSYIWLSYGYYVIGKKLHKILR